MIIVSFCSTVICATSVATPQLPLYFLAARSLTSWTYFFWASAALRSLYSAHLLYFALPYDRENQPPPPPCLVFCRIETYLEVEGASLRGVLELGVLVTLFEQSVELEDDVVSSAPYCALHERTGCFDWPHLKELIVAKGLGEVLAVGDGLSELGGLGDHVCG